MRKISDVIKFQLIAIALAADSDASKKNRIMYLYEKDIINSFEASKLIKDYIVGEKQNAQN